MSVLSSSRRTEWTLRVDWPICKARGFCHELVPDRIDLDEWGYPIVKGTVTRAQVAAAREAVRTCPTLALRLQRA